MKRPFPVLRRKTVTTRKPGKSCSHDGRRRKHTQRTWTRRAHATGRQESAAPASEADRGQCARVVSWRRPQPLR